METPTSSSSSSSSSAPQTSTPIPAPSPQATAAVATDSDTNNTKFTNYKNVNYGQVSIDFARKIPDDKKTIYPYDKAFAATKIDGLSAKTHFGWPADFDPHQLQFQKEDESSLMEFVNVVDEMNRNLILANKDKLFSADDRKKADAILLDRYKSLLVEGKLKKDSEEERWDSTVNFDLIQECGSLFLIVKDSNNKDTEPTNILSRRNVDLVIKPHGLKKKNDNFYPVFYLYQIKLKTETAGMDFPKGYQPIKMKPRNKDSGNNKKRKDPPTGGNNNGASGGGIIRHQLDAASKR